MTSLASSDFIKMEQRYGILLLGTTLHQQVRVSPHSVSLSSSTLLLETPLSGIHNSLVVVLL